MAAGPFPGSRPQSGGRSKHEGLRVRLRRIDGETPKGVLHRPLVLPAVLRGFGWTEEFMHSDYDTIADGQFSQPAAGGASARQLRTIDDIETLTMIWQPQWLIYVDAGQVERELRAVGRSKKPVELLATPYLGGGARKPLLRASITIRSLSVALREGEPDTTYFTLRIEEWRNASTKRRGAGHSKLPTTVEIDANDTLYGLSDRFYKTHAGWKEIARENGIPNFGPSTPLVQHKRFRVGSKLKIPIYFKGQPDDLGNTGVHGGMAA